MNQDTLASIEQRLERIEKSLSHTRGLLFLLALLVVLGSLGLMQGVVGVAFVLAILGCWLYVCLRFADRTMKRRLASYEERDAPAEVDSPIDAQ